MVLIRTLLIKIKVKNIVRAEGKTMTYTKEELQQKLDKLSAEQLNSVGQFVEFLEYKQQPVESKTPMTNGDIDRVVESYRRENKQRPIGLAKGEFVTPDDFNDPLPDEILDLFEPK